MCSPPRPSGTHVQTFGPPFLPASGSCGIQQTPLRRHIQRPPHFCTAFSPRGFLRAFAPSFARPPSSFSWVDTTPAVCSLLRPMSRALLLCFRTLPCFPFCLASCFCPLLAFVSAFFVTKARSRLAYYEPFPDPELRFPAQYSICMCAL